MVCVFLLADAWMAADNEITVHLAVIGHLIGEIAAAIFTIFCLCFFPPQPRRHSQMPADRHAFNERFIAVASPLMLLAMPLMGNRLVLNILASAEAIWIPSRLQMFRLSNLEAFSIYGVLTGMALPAGVKIGNKKSYYILGHSRLL